MAIEEMRAMVYEKLEFIKDDCNFRFTKTFLV